MLTTYGAWLHGDPRGFRTHQHRVHVEGDYKKPPPPGKYDDLARLSRESLVHAPVTVPPRLCPVVGQAVLERLQELGAFVLCVSVSGRHVHLLAKMPPPDVKKWIGLAKKHTWFEIRDRGWNGKLWAKKCKPVRVRDRPHQPGFPICVEPETAPRLKSQFQPTS